MRLFLLTAVLAGSLLVAAAAPGPRRLIPRARVGHGISHAYKVQHDASLSKTPKTVRKRYKMTHHEGRKYRRRHARRHR